MAWHFQRAFTIPFYFRALHDGMEYGPGSYRIANMQELNRRGCFNKGACVREADRSTFRMGRSPPRAFNTCLLTTTVEANSPIFPSFPTSNFNQLCKYLKSHMILHGRYVFVYKSGPGYCTHSSPRHSWPNLYSMATHNATSTLGPRQHAPTTRALF